jgi:hypothetical protein
MTRPGTASPEAIRACLEDLVAQRGAGKTVCPSEVARALGGSNPDEWGRLMTPVRRVAVALMKEGRVTILRKGHAVDPDDFKGVYRIGPAGSGKPPKEPKGDPFGDDPDDED